MSQSPQAPTIRPGSSRRSVSLSSQGRNRLHYQKLDVPTKIHILGSGGIGKLVAHSLRGIPDPPPVTLLIHRPTYLNDFRKANNVISLTTGRNKEDRGGFETELVQPNWRAPKNIQHLEAYSNPEPIYNLILTTKAHQTIKALSDVAHRLTPDSTILFLQNGMGTEEEVNEKLFPDVQSRPNYMLGVNSHGVYSTSTCAATHAGQGTIRLGILPRHPFKGVERAEPDPDKKPDPDLLWGKGSRYLLRTLTRTPVLAAVGLTPTDLLQAQLEKLAVNCLLNPLTVMLDCRNGDLLNNFAVSRTMNLLLAEISLVMNSLPELRGIPNVPLRLSPERLLATTVHVAQQTAENISSMLQDVRRGMQTEIEYINGYIVKRGEELGIKPVMNYMLMQMVMGKQQMISKEMDNYAPFK